MTGANKCPQRGNRYKTEQEKRDAYLNAQSRYSSKRVYCKLCDCETSLANKAKHMKTQKHMLNKERRNEYSTVSESESFPEFH